MPYGHDRGVVTLTALTLCHILQFFRNIFWVLINSIFHFPSLFIILHHHFKSLLFYFIHSLSVSFINSYTSYRMMIYVYIVCYLLTCEIINVGETKRQLKSLPIVKHFGKRSPSNFHVTTIIDYMDYSYFHNGCQLQCVDT